MSNESPPPMRLWRMRADALFEATDSSDALLALADYLVALSEGEPDPELFVDGYLEIGTLKRDS